MRRILALIAVLSFSATFAGAAAHDAAFWKAIAANQYQVPPGESASALMSELSAYLGSPDPELRDDIAYSTIVQWVYVKRLIGPEQLRPFITEWEANLGRGLGERGTESVLRRSFSALALSVVAARDAAEPFLTREDVREMLHDALRYLVSERDLRGFDPKIGWIHATAHTADLLKFLARGRYLERADQRAIVRALVARVSSAQVVFTHGEDERLARVVLSLVARPDFDGATFRAELAAVVVPKFELKEEVMMRIDNVRHFLTTLYLLLHVDERVQESPHLVDVQNAVLQTAKRAY